MVLRTSLVKCVCVGLGAMAIASSVHAAPKIRTPVMNSSCTLQDGEGKEVEGTNSQVRYPIASVSKVFTSYWAISRFGANFRYATRIFVTPVDAETKTADVHIAGTFDPYFDKERFQFLVSELNKLGVKKVRNLTFDERFAFSQIRGFRNRRVLDISDDDFAWSTVLPTYPLANSVESSLRLALKNLNTGYNITRKAAAHLHKIDMLQAVSIKVDDVSFLSEDVYTPPASTKMFFMRSAPMHILLKAMNSQSNNWVAEMIFKSLGGADQFAPFIHKALGLEEKDISFVNGSGNRIDPEGPGVYNEATCEAVVKVLASMSEKMTEQGMNLSDIMAVAGESVHGTTNTVGSYVNEGTSHALVAKTGSINPTIALAGLASTNDGDVYFAYNYGTTGKGQWSPARAKIRLDVNNLFKAHDKKKIIDSDSELMPFLSFDIKSTLIPAKPEQIRGKVS